MCRFCEDRDEYYEESLIDGMMSLGDLGDIKMWVLVEPGSDYLALHLLHGSSAKELRFKRKIQFCPVCGRNLYDMTR